ACQPPHSIVSDQTRPHSARIPILIAQTFSASAVLIISCHQADHPQEQQWQGLINASSEGGIEHAGRLIRRAGACWPRPAFASRCWAASIPNIHTTRRRPIVSRAPGLTPKG